MKKKILGHQPSLPLSCPIKRLNIIKNLATEQNEIARDLEITDVFTSNIFLTCRTRLKK